MDQRAMRGGTTVRFADGRERFSDLGSGQVEAPAAGEVIFVDETGLVSARRWCWRQSAESASGDGTTEVLVTVEGHHDGAAADIAAALDDLQALMRIHASPVALTAGMVTASAPAFESSLASATRTADRHPSG
jgi:DNA/RNA-binding domain of Phe-tRNA-synthetase-like protein